MQFSTSLQPNKTGIYVPVYMCVFVYVRGVAGEPSQIKCTLNGNGKVKLGQKVDGDIQVHVRDKHGNEIKKVKQTVMTSHVLV